MACHLVDAKALSEQIMEYFLLDPWEETFEETFENFVSNGGHFVLASMS